MAEPMNTRQTVLAAVVLGAVCCGVMWMLEGFRQRKMIEDFRSVLETLPTYMKDGAK